LLFVAIMTLGGTGKALAHASPKTEDPPAGTTVGTAPSVVSITFTESIEARFSGIIVENGEGKRVDDGDSRPDPNDASQLSVGLKQPLAAGVYTVIWHALSTDGHRTHGSYGFSVAR